MNPYEHSLILCHVSVFAAVLGFQIIWQFDLNNFIADFPEHLHLKRFIKSMWEFPGEYITQVYL